MPPATAVRPRNRFKSNSNKRAGLHLIVNLPCRSDVRDAVVHAPSFMPDPAVGKGRIASSIQVTLDPGRRLGRRAISGQNT